ncbi:MAG TPA: hypothetical protein VFZ61_30005, partial [Polyangiales bacterium]
MLWRVLLSNLPFAVALSVVAELPEFVQVLVVGAVLFFAPGLAWADRRTGDAFLVLFRTVMLSLVAALATWVVVGILPGNTSRIGFLLVLAAITNAGLYVGWKRGF